jgi:hypothetical protein
MRFKDGVLKARSQIVFLVGLVSALGLIILLEHWEVEGVIVRRPAVEKTAEIPTAQPRALTQQEREWAQIAWQYFRNNTKEQTGLVNSVDNYPASTLWDTASSLMGIIAAYRLEVITQGEFDGRVTNILRSLAKIPLFENHLPNKSYNTESLVMVDYGNKPVARGIGWSAIDIARFLVPLNIIAWNYPQHLPAIRAVVKRWDMNRMLRNGYLYGSYVDSNGETILVQEGRLGYEEYAAKSLSLLGLDTLAAQEHTDFLKYIRIHDIQVPVDSREPEKYGAHNYVVSEPYILDGLEFGWDDTSREFAYRVYAVQRERFVQTGMLTAVSEDNIDQAPYFVYNTVYTSGQAWNCITDEGKNADNFRSISTKAAFGWHALYGTPYTNKLIDRIHPLHNRDRGWYSGLYEKSQQPNKAITANTNAIVLEALAYKRFGKLVRMY